MSLQQARGWITHRRPGVEAFLKRLSTSYEIICFTSGLKVALHLNLHVRIMFGGHNMGAVRAVHHMPSQFGVADFMRLNTA